MRLRRNLQLETRVGATLRRAGVRAAALVVAVSGGPDSTAMLLALQRLAGDFELRLSVAHFDHQLRPSSAEDAAFVRDMAAGLRLPCADSSGDVRGFAARQGLSLEDAGRRLRYGFLQDAAAAAGAAFVAVGHTADDQVESVLLHLVRGSGVRGLGGMDVVDGWPVGGDGPRVLRPLLALRRAEVLAYCEAAGARYRIDESNLTAAFTRNRVRNELVPVLESLNPAAVEAILRLADAARADSGLLEAQAATAADALVERRGPVARVRRDLAARLPDPLLFRVLEAAADAGATGLDSVHLRALTDLVRTRASGREGVLPGGVRAWSEGEWLLIGEVVAVGAGGEASGTLTIPGETVVAGWTLEAGGETEGADFQARLRLPAGTDRLEVRTRRQGDRIRVPGVGVRKLQDAFVDARVPRRLREGWPVVCLPEGAIAWVPGVVVGDGVTGGGREVWVSARRPANVVEGTEGKS